MTTTKTFLVDCIKQNMQLDRIGQILSRIKGIECFSLHPEQKSIFVEYDMDVIPEEILRDMIEDEGFVLVK